MYPPTFTFRLLLIVNDNKWQIVKELIEIIPFTNM